MRRFSAKNNLVTLNEINITPLLDLAFVLLIIFIITTPLLEQSLDLTVPTGSAPASTVRKDQVRTVEVDPKGGYVVQGKKYTLAELEGFLANERRASPDIAVFVRADEDERFKNVHAVYDILGRLEIKKLKVATRPERK